MRPYRTLLEQKIRERRMTLEEFAAYAESFAREHGEPGTLSLRHLQRLVAGKGPKGQPLGSIRPATARLLERIFESDSNELLSSPMQAVAPPDDDAADLRERIRKARRVDAGMLQGLRDELNAIRRIDRQYGAIVTHNKLLAKISQARELLAYSLTGKIRQKLAILLSEMHALAGWQTLDLGIYTSSWNHHEMAKKSALEASEAAYHAHAKAEQAFTLIDLGDTKAAIDLLDSASHIARFKCSNIVRAWISAAQGEAFAANGETNRGLRLFDDSSSLLARSQDKALEGPYLILDNGHLRRWRGHALACFANRESLDDLTYALNNLDSTFIRAEAGLQVDLSSTFLAFEDREPATRHLERAEKLASTIGSVRQLDRVRSLRSRHGIYPQ